MKVRVILHPILFGLYPVLFVCAHNVDLAPPGGEVIMLLALVGCCVALLWGTLAVVVLLKRHLLDPGSGPQHRPWVPDFVRPWFEEERGFWRPVEQPEISKTIPYPRGFWKDDGMDISPDGRAPHLGEHTRAILKELDYGDAEIAALTETGVAR